MWLSNLMKELKKSIITLRLVNKHNPPNNFYNLCLRFPAKLFDQMKSKYKD